MFRHYLQGSRRQKIWEKIGWRSEGCTSQFASNTRNERLVASRLGKSPHGRVITMGQAWAIYAEKHLPSIKRPDYDKGRYQTYIAPKFGDTPLDQITTLDVETFKQELFQTKLPARGPNSKPATKTLAPATVRHVLSLMGRVYGKMSLWGLYKGKSPLEAIKQPKLDNARVRYLTPEEAERLLAELKKIPSSYWWAVACVSLNTGMRLGEILNLRGSDIDLAAGVIHVRDAKAGTRIAHMPDTCKQLFMELMPASGKHLLFCDSQGKAVSVGNVSKTFVRVVGRMGFNKDITDPRQRVVFHTLRHTLLLGWPSVGFPYTPSLSSWAMPVWR